MTAAPDDAPFDSLLVLSFGGPEGPDDVRPFLENVTRGRGIPPERLDEVAEHYLHFGGVSPINAQNRGLIARIEARLAQQGLALPVYFGNRNWHPMIEDTVEEMYAASHRRALVFVTSAWGGFSGCGQYHDDIGRALAALDERTGGALAASPMTLRKLPHYWDRPEMAAACADAIRDAHARLPADPNEHVRLVFTAHSIPVVADEHSGPPGETHLYSRQVHAAAAAAAEASGFEEYDVVWQSRSGPPQVPWLEPDVCDHLETLPASDVTAVIVCPIGFISDHLEVLWDLDAEAKDKAAELGLGFARAATVSDDPRFVDMAVDLVAAHAGGAAVFGNGCAENGARCAPGCCPSARPTRPAHAAA